MTKNERWKQDTNTFWPTSTAMQTEKLPPGLYSWRNTPNGWYLLRTDDRFDFPCKIYGNHSHIIDRIQKMWEHTEGNLGILLNGLKGTGKTVTAQLLCNWAIENELPVLVVQNPIPLMDVLQKTNQEIVVLFDEFEKTHHEEHDQQHLLTAIDGVARNKHARLFIFTTNQKKINENLVDRPSRVRYSWEFDRMGEELIEELMDDLLTPDLRHFRSDITTFLNTRKVVSIDVAKAVINEVNIFRESPTEFAGVLNLSEQDCNDFVVEVLDKERNVIHTLSSYFKPIGGSSASNLLRNMMTKSGHKAAVQQVEETGGSRLFQSLLGCAFTMTQGTDVSNEWICNVQVPLHDTWIDKFPKLAANAYEKRLWMDVKPPEWRVPAWVHRLQKGEILTDEEQTLMDEWQNSYSVYGTSTYQPMLLRITPNFSMHSTLPSAVSSLSDYSFVFNS